MRVSRFAAAVLLSVAAACGPMDPLGQTTEKHAEDQIAWKPTSFVELNGWTASNFPKTFLAFKASCAVLASRRDMDPMGGAAGYGSVGDWRAACQTALQLEPASNAEARQFFETWFQPVQVLNGVQPVGLFTGYYEPELTGRRKPNKNFTVPLYSRPADLVMVDLGTFRPALKGERVAGRVDGGKLVPYATRAQIVSAGPGGGARPLVFVDSAVDAFFLEIQGSGRVKLDTGETVRVAFDGQNGHPYTAVGRMLVDRGEIERSQLSMQSIRGWLDAHPDKAQELMNENASYVFFKEMAIADPAVGADGAQGVALTPEASVAVDLKFHALGVPLWIDAKAPSADSGREDEVFQRLFVAQDTGGAIRGPVRADVYWGAGPTAESVAGRMAHKGRLFVLMPKSVAARLN